MKQEIESRMNGYDNPNQFAACNGYSHGLVYNGLKGIWSDTLAEQMGITKYPPRPGIFISCSEETKALYAKMKGDMTWSEWLEKLALADMGIGEVV